MKIFKNKNIQLVQVLEFLKTISSKQCVTLKIYLLLLLLIFFTACSKGDDDPTPTINAANFSASIDENPENNASLGTISASGTGTLNYSITSQIPNGALTINSITGELKVANASLFDFETNPNIDAVITILYTEATTTINATISLNDVDDIASFLITSKTAYANANDGDWIEVTETEYNDLASKLNEVSKVGTSDTQYNVTPSNTNTAQWTVVNDTNSEIPSGGFIFAFKYYINSAIDATGCKIKQSGTIDDNFSDLGNSLPIHSATEASVYFVLKGNTTQLTTQGYISFYKSSGINMGIRSSNIENYYFGLNDVNSGFTLEDGYLLYQGLSSTQKQWD
jgi:hypothetical protein